MPAAMEGRFNEIVECIRKVCDEHLNAEYATLATEATAQLARKRPSPLQGGRVSTWACGVLQALGTVNFLFDKSQDPHISSGDLYKAFGVASSTGAAKGKEIRYMLKMSYFDNKWTLPSKREKHPIAWTIMVHG